MTQKRTTEAEKGNGRSGPRYPEEDGFDIVLTGWEGAVRADDVQMHLEN